jgi:hypothetical protein
MLACTVALGAGEAAAPVEIARSSLLTLSGSAEPGSLTLSVRRSADPAPLVVSEFAATVDGRGAPATRSPDGTWSVPLASLGSGEHQLGVTVGHDGIRELLAGKFTAAAGSAPAGAIAGLGGNHKQMLWWALNIGIVLAAAIAISRRMS